MTTKENMNSIQKIAKFAGVLYLLITVFAIYAHFYVPGELIVDGDAATTADNIMANAGLFRAGIFSELIILLSEIVLSLLLYELLKPVNKTLSLIAAVSRLAMTTIHGLNLLNHLFVLLLLSGAGYLTVFEPAQLNALVMLFLEGHSYGFSIGIVFLSLHAILLGYLIYKSGYFPKILGVLFIIASLGYLIDSFSLLLLPNYVEGQAFIALPIAIAEIAFPLWLLFKGVNAEQWEKRALESA